MLKSLGTTMAVVLLAGIMGAGNADAGIMTHIHDSAIDFKNKDQKFSNDTIFYGSWQPGSDLINVVTGDKCTQEEATGNGAYCFWGNDHNDDDNDLPWAN